MSAPIPSGLAPRAVSEESAIQPAATEQPPSYEEDQVDNVNAVVQPITFVLRGLFVYAEPNESSALYQLSRVILALGQATTIVEFQRLDYRVRSTADRTPGVSQRAKPLYNLQRAPILFTNNFDLTMQSLSRQSLGDVVMKKSSMSFRGHHATRLLTGAALEREMKNGYDPDEYYFAVKRKASLFGKKHPYQWSDAEGNEVATEELELGTGENSNQPKYKLLVTVPLKRPMVDGLVALWCLSLWHRHARRTRERRGWKHFKRVMQLPRPESSRLPNFR